MSVFKTLSPPGEAGKAWHSNCIMKGWYWFENREEKVILCRVKRKCQSCEIIYPNKISWLRVNEIEWWRDQQGRLGVGVCVLITCIYAIHLFTYFINSEMYFIL